MDIRPVTADELPAYLRTTEGAFHEDVHPDDVGMLASIFEPERSLATFEGGEIVATTGIYTRELTVPGATMTVAGVTLVGVLPTHRRRGLLTGLMRRQLDDVRAAGESVAALWASEAAIYGRFGYGAAARHATVTLRTTGARIAPGVAQPGGRMTLLEPPKALARMAPLYDRLRRERVGHFDRTEPWWRRRIRDPEHLRGGRSALRAAVHEDGDGAVDGYVVYNVKSDWNDGPDCTVLIREIVADGPEAAVALWAYVLGLDLTRTVEWWIAPSDEPLPELISAPQNAELKLGANLWVRLVDVGAALAARTYAGPIDVVFDITDEFCPWNAGRWRLAADGDGATCEPTTAPADLALGAIDLGAAYLGGTSLAALAAIGRVRGLRPGAIERAALAFGTVRAPYCPEIF